MLLLFYFSSCDQAADQYGWSGRTMGTTYQVKITKAELSGPEIDQLKKMVDSALVEVNRQMSTYDPASEISQFNEYQDTLAFKVSPEFALVVARAKEISHLSGGAFDITVANLVNLWGFGKTGPRIVPPAEEDIHAELDLVGIEYIKTLKGTALQKMNPQVRIDLSAIAKGYGVDIIARVLESRQLANYISKAK